jgi:CubicO group peptidase (beta-lactamase class C family)
MGIVEGHCDARFAVVREIFEKSFASGEEIGAGICFYLDGEKVVDLWGGHRDVAATQPWTRDTLVNVYSTTKGMTALCAHQLVERGLLDIDAPVAKYWPEFAQKDKGAIPVRWLLSHQAGLPAVRKPLTQQDLYDWNAMAAALAEQEPWWEPGTRHGYHALTFGYLVGEVIRRVSGVSVGTFFRENVAGPLGADFHIGLAAAYDASRRPSNACSYLYQERHKGHDSCQTRQDCLCSDARKPRAIEDRVLRLPGKWPRKLGSNQNSRPC